MRLFISFLLVVPFLLTAQWSKLPGTGLGKAIAIGNGGTPWVIGMGDRIHPFKGANWGVYGNGAGKDITVYNGIPYVIGTDNAIYYGSNNNWYKLAGNGLGKAITIGSGGRLWVIGVDNGIYWFNGSRWQAYANGSGRGKDIAVYNGIPYVIGTDNAVYVGTGNGWRRLHGNGYGKRITVDNHGKLFLVGTDDGVYSFNGSTWVNHGGNARDIAAFNGVLYMVGADNSVWKFGNQNQSNYSAQQAQEQREAAQRVEQERIAAQKAEQLRQAQLNAQQAVQAQQTQVGPDGMPIGTQNTEAVASNNFNNSFYSVAFPNYLFNKTFKNNSSTTSYKFRQNFVEWNNVQFNIFETGYNSSSRVYRLVTRYYSNRIHQDQSYVFFMRVDNQNQFAIEKKGPFNDPNFNYRQTVGYLEPMYKVQYNSVSSQPRPSNPTQPQQNFGRKAAAATGTAIIGGATAVGKATKKTGQAYQQAGRQVYKAAAPVAKKAANTTKKVAKKAANTTKKVANKAKNTLKKLNPFAKKKKKKKKN